jgi:hypothetical protein
MIRKISCVGIICLVAACAGCTMCCHPYDCNGPVYDNSGQSLSNVRAGSILEGGAMEVTPAETTKKIPEQGPNAQASPKTGEFEGATKILSVTDRKLDKAEKNQPNEGQNAPILAQPAPVIRR